jgi:small subunit ribosomal protein S8
MVNYSSGDFLIQAKNTAMAGNKSLVYKPNAQVVRIADALKKLGFFSEVKKQAGQMEITLSFKDKKPILTDIKLVSKPGRRIYLGSKEIAKKRGPSIYLISSPKGIISCRQAIKDNLGGEIIAEIW